MRAQDLLVELEEAGVYLTLEGENLRYQTHPEIRFEPFREYVVAHKSELMAELLKAHILAVVNVDQSVFDRNEFDRLFALWRKFDAMGAAE